MLELLLITSIVWEWLLYIVPNLWRIRRWLVAGPLILVCFSSSGLLFESWGVIAGLLLLASVFRVINYLRIAKGRMHEQYLLRATRRTGFALGVLQLGLLFARLWFEPDWVMGLGVIAAGQVAAGLVVLFSVLRNFVKTGYKDIGLRLADKDLPTVTVAIPARNETADLEPCLRSVLASDYPKLEVLVLDDCSQDKTAEIIRSFAHDGVRFVKGYEPEERWLAKNQAYDKLADEASGQLVLFCGVDVRLGAGAIRALVLTMKSRKKDMISVMPRRLSGDLLNAFIQPMRYWWELALPRRYFNRPPVLSSCWMIKSKTLKKLGGMEAVQHAIIPEGYFARELVKTDGYSFMRAGAGLDIRTQKGLAQQRDTALRMRYPQVRRRPEWVMLISLAEVVLLFGPFVVLAGAIWSGFGLAQMLALAACVLLTAANVAIIQLSNPPHTWLALFSLPAAVLTEIVIGYSSMLKYEFSEVLWKGRNVCIPVMHVYPRLPDIDKR